MTDRARPTPEQLETYARGFNESLTLRFFGVRVDFPDVETVRCTLPIQPGHRGGLGSEAVNGGILAAMFDLAIGCAGALVDPTRKTATIQLSMNFERGVVGNTLYAYGKIDRAGGTSGFARAWIEDDQGRTCAHAMGVIRLSAESWAAGAHPGIN